MKSPNSAFFINLCAALAASALTFAAGCAARGPEADEREIVVAAAANLTDAFDEMGRRFKERTGVRVVNGFGATADLARQIEHGAPFDVFASADVSHVEGLAGKGLLAEGASAVYARGRLVLWLPSPGASGVVRVEELAEARVTRVALAKPDVAPYGRAAVEALRSLGVWEKVEPKVVYAQSVAQAKQFAATGNADAAFIPRALVREGEGSFVEIEERLHAPIEQAIAVVRESERQREAKQFVEFVLGEEGREILKRYGYGLPSE